MEDIMNRICSHNDASDNRTIQSNIKESLILQEDSNSANTGTKTACLKCLKTFKFT